MDPVESLKQSFAAQWDGSPRGRQSGSGASKYNAPQQPDAETQELERLATRLSTQIDYSNQLLRQVRTLEEKQLQNQRDLHSKQSALQDAMQACDSARTEAQDLRRKLAIAEVTTSLIREWAVIHAVCRRLRKICRSSARKHVLKLVQPTASLMMPAMSFSVNSTFLSGHCGLC